MKNENIFINVFTKNLNHINTKIVKKMLCYLKKSMDYAKIYSNNKKNISIEDYSNSNWAKDKKSLKSISSFIFILNKSFIN